jgi:hypothetical protein
MDCAEGYNTIIEVEMAESPIVINNYFIQGGA